MVDTMNNDVSSSSVDETRKQRKKQAKREAKAMLAVEQAKQGVQRAEQKVAKFQARLEASIAHLRTLEAKLARIRTSPQAPETGTSSGGVDGHQEQTQPAQETTSANAGSSETYTVTEEDEATTEAPAPASPVNTAPPKDQEVSLPPAEGRADILPDQETAQPASGTGEEVPDTEENFQWRAGSENKTTPAYDTTSSSTDSQEQETQEGLGSTTKQSSHTKAGEWQPEEDVSQDTDTDY